jgi:WD40 repeat protein
MGFNYKMVNGAINLTREKENPRSGEDNTIQEIFYCVGHTGVIYNYSEKKSDNRQRLLQGHCNQIKSVAYSHSKGVIITADKGPNSLLVVWDVNSGTPKRCIFDPHPNGVKYLDVTADGSIIVTISREKKDSVSKHIVQQTVCLWRWEEDSN